MMCKFTFLTNNDMNGNKCVEAIAGKKGNFFYLENCSSSFSKNYRFQHSLDLLITLAQAPAWPALLSLSTQAHVDNTKMLYPWTIEESVY